MANSVDGCPDGEGGGAPPGGGTGPTGAPSGPQSPTSPAENAKPSGLECANLWAQLGVNAGLDILSLSGVGLAARGFKAFTLAGAEHMMLQIRRSGTGYIVGDVRRLRESTANLIGASNMLGDGARQVLGTQLSGVAVDPQAAFGLSGVLQALIPFAGTIGTVKEIYASGC